MGCYEFFQSTSSKEPQAAGFGVKKSSGIAFCSPEVPHLGAGKLEVESGVGRRSDCHGHFLAWSRDSQRGSPAGLSL